MPASRLKPPPLGSTSHAWTILGVQSGIAGALLLRPVAVQPLAELPDQFPFRPGQALIVDLDDRDALGTPAFLLDGLGRRAIAAVTPRDPLDRDTSKSKAA